MMDRACAARRSRPKAGAVEVPPESETAGFRAHPRRPRSSRGSASPGQNGRSGLARPKDLVRTPRAPPSCTEAGPVPRGQDPFGRRHGTVCLTVLRGGFLRMIGPRPCRSAARAALNGPVRGRKRPGTHVRAPCRAGAPKHEARAPRILAPAAAGNKGSAAAAETCDRGPMRHRSCPAARHGAAPRDAPGAPSRTPHPTKAPRPRGRSAKPRVSPRSPGRRRRSCLLPADEEASMSPRSPP